MIKTLLKGCFLLFFVFPVVSFGALTDNLVSYWDLNETDGARFDSTIRDNDLTDNNSVLYGAGILGNAGDFEATDTEFLSIVAGDQTDLAISSDFSISLWAKFESLPTAGNAEFLVARKDLYMLGAVYNTAGTYKFILNIDGTSKLIEWVPNLGTWYHIVEIYDASAGTIDVYVDDTPLTQQTGLPNSIPTTDATFYIGSDGYGTGYTMDGLIDEVGVWDRILTSDEITALYNGGVGVAYPFGEGEEASSTPATTTPLVYEDWIFVSMVQIFLLSFIGIGILFSIFRVNRK